MSKPIERPPAAEVALVAIIFVAAVLLLIVLYHPSEPTLLIEDVMAKKVDVDYPICVTVRPPSLLMPPGFRAVRKRQDKGIA